MAPTRIGVVGCGYWGPNLVRTFLELPEATVVAVADHDPERLAAVRRRHAQVADGTREYRDLLGMGLDAVVVATPPETHFEVAAAFLDSGLDVFVEKPLATTTVEAVALADLAEARGRVLMVGHIGAYNPAVTALKEMVAGGELGEIRYVDAVRAGLGLYHARLNVIWDLAPHDLAILLHVLGESPESVGTRGIGCVRRVVEDVAYLTATFPSGVLAHARLSWLDPCKTRRITVVGSEKMVLYDDLEPHEKVKVYDKRVSAVPRTDTFGDFQFAYHYGSVVSPYIEFTEPLRLECLHFLDCVRHRRRPLTDGRNGVEVVRLIEAAHVSLRDGGVQVPVAPLNGARRPVHGGRATGLGRELLGAAPDGARAPGRPLAEHA